MQRIKYHNAIPINIAAVRILISIILTKSVIIFIIFRFLSIMFYFV